MDLKSALSGCVQGSRVKCYRGPPGSGKTHQMRKQMELLSRSSATCVLSITEAFAIGDAARKLHAAALSAAGNPLTVGVHINLGKFKHSERGNVVTRTIEANNYWNLASMLYCANCILLPLTKLSLAQTHGTRPFAMTSPLMDLADMCGAAVTLSYSVAVWF